MHTDRDRLVLCAAPDGKARVANSRVSLSEPVEVVTLLPSCGGRGVADG